MVLVPDEGHNADGKHVSYLDDGHTVGGALRALDPELHDALRKVIANGRSVDALERSGALPLGTVTYANPLDFDGLPSSATAARRQWRAAWLERALESTAGADLVFVDPDNGLRRTDHSTSAHTTRANKHCYLDELAPFAERGQSVVAYHHADRTAPVESQIQRRLAELERTLPIAPLAAVRASRGTTRLFLIAAEDAHRQVVSERLRAIEQGPWGTELRITWWDTTSRTSEHVTTHTTWQSVTFELPVSDLESLRHEAAVRGVTIAELLREIVGRRRA